MSMQKLNQKANQDFINKGGVLSNYRATTFKLFWSYYSTNKRRQLVYKLDDTEWKVTHHGFWWKVNAVLKGAVRLRHRKVK